MNADSSDEERARYFESVLSPLSERERDVLIMRFGLIDRQSHTLQETADHFGVTRERIRQIEAGALRKLRHPRRDDGMAGALVRR